MKRAVQMLVACAVLFGSFSLCTLLAIAWAEGAVQGATATLGGCMIVGAIGVMWLDFHD